MPDWKVILGTACGGVIAWVGAGFVRSVKNYGKTELEIAEGHLDDALKRAEKAAATPDKTDDVQAAADVASARRIVEKMKRLSAITDGFGE
jgi:hypothetical protein